MSASALIPASELAEKLAQTAPPVLLDASWHMPAAKRDGRAEFVARRIPGARFFDIDAIRDAESEYPHMLPTAEEFARAMGTLGLRETDEIVIYDTAGLFSAPRAWWMLRVMGHRGRVRVLNGGLPAWIAAGHPVESGMPALLPPAIYRAEIQPTLLADCRMVEAASARGEVVLDARSASRFSGAEVDPRAGVRPGHIPGSTNLHYARLLDDGGCLLPQAALRALFAECGVGAGPVIGSCGSGVTACILALGLHETGREAMRVYDGSWAEWGARTDLPVVSVP